MMEGLEKITHYLRLYELKERRYTNIQDAKGILGSSAEAVAEAVVDIYSYIFEFQAQLI